MMADGGGGGAPARILNPVSLHDIVNSVGGDEKLDPEVEQLLLELADEFVENCASGAAALARHRNSNTIDAADLNLHLEKNWGLSVPGNWMGADLPAAAASGAAGTPSSSTAAAAAGGIGSGSAIPPSTLASTIATGASVTMGRTLRRLARLDSHSKRLQKVQQLKSKEDAKKLGGSKSNK